MIKSLRLLLLPFSLLYGIVVVLRNKCYDLGFLKSTRFDLPVICVGNLVVGGSGKSPVTEYLVHLLGDYKVAILSRGYGRDTKGFIYADATATARSIGDEPLQFYHKFPQVTVAVCEDRVYGVTQLKDTHDVILLDDAYQHRRLSPGFSILLFDYHKLLAHQFLLPAGDLREPFKGYQRADVLMVTKAPINLSAQQKSSCAAKFGQDVQPQLFFSSIQYGDLVGLRTKETLSCAVLQDKIVFLLTGIANPKPLLEKLGPLSLSLIHHDYPDHHSYTSGNISKLVEAYLQHPAKEKIIITTEKDAQRLFDVTIGELLLNLPVFYLPISIVIAERGHQELDQKILKYVSDTTRNR